MNRDLYSCASLADLQALCKPTELNDIRRGAASDREILMFTPMIRAFDRAQSLTAFCRAARSRDDFGIACAMFVMLGDEPAVDCAAKIAKESWLLGALRPKYIFDLANYLVREPAPNAIALLQKCADSGILKCDYLDFASLIRGKYTIRKQIPCLELSTDHLLRREFFEALATDDSGRELAIAENIHNSKNMIVYADGTETLVGEFLRIHGVTCSDDVFVVMTAEMSPAQLDELLHRRCAIAIAAVDSRRFVSMLRRIENPKYDLLVSAYRAGLAAELYREGYPGVIALMKRWKLPSLSASAFEQYVETAKATSDLSHPTGRESEFLEAVARAPGDIEWMMRIFEWMPEHSARALDILVDNGSVEVLNRLVKLHNDSFILPADASPRVKEFFAAKKGQAGL